MISGVTTTPADLRNLASKKTLEASEAPESGDRKDAAGKAGDSGTGDRVTLGSRPPDAVYGKSAGGELSLDARLTVFHELVARMFEKQGFSSLSIDIGEGKTASLKDLTPGQAADLVADDGYWGVEKTSQRIFDFALKAAGSDPAKLESIKAAVMKGFSMAGKAFGGSLPDISSRTLDSVMNKLDDWGREQAASSKESPEPPTAA